jgi:hypothetical protein
MAVTCAGIRLFSGSIIASGSSCFGLGSWSHKRQSRL